MLGHLRACSLAAAIAISALPDGNAAAQVYLTEGTNISVDVAEDGRMAIDLLGDLWIVPPDGGEATSLLASGRIARRPRWSPGGDALVYEANTDGHDELRLLRLTDGDDHSLSALQWSDRQPYWHPDGDRIVFSSARNDTGFDLWEVDISTGLSWRLSHLPGNESEPAWSADGRNLIYVHEHDGLWSIILRAHGEPDEVVISSDERLAAPSWRPDGSLFTYLRNTPQGWSVSMTILSEPRLDRTMMDGEDFFIGPVAWRDRQQLYYAANGQLRTRNFNAWSSANIPFRARVGRAATTSEPVMPRRVVGDINAPSRRTVIRAGRLFDGIVGRYRYNADIIIDGGMITAIAERADHDDAIVVDLGDLTVMPGYIDAHARLPASTALADGPMLLSLGLTTVAADFADSQQFNEVWTGKQIPGPRIVNESWQASFEAGTAAFPGNHAMPVSPAGQRYQDVFFAGGSASTTWLSGLADASTPQVDQVWNSRQAKLVSRPRALAQRFTATPDLSAVATTIVLASQPNGLPAGIGLHAELRGLTGAGLTSEQALKACGVNAAAALGFGPQLGRIAPGSAADLVLVDGDPLAHVGDAQKIVGVVRNGRFFSVSGLIERAENAQTVE